VLMLAELKGDLDAVFGDFKRLCNDPMYAGMLINRSREAVSLGRRFGNSIHC